MGILPYHSLTMSQPRRWHLKAACIGLILLQFLVMIGWLAQTTPGAQQGRRVFIVQGASSDEVAAAVTRAAGTVVARLPLIDAVSAELAPSSVQALSGDPLVRAVYEDRPVYPAIAASQQEAKKDPEPLEAPSVAMNATSFHQKNVVGSGVTVAVVDTGLAPLDSKGWTPFVDGSIKLAGKKASDGFIVFRDFVDATGQDVLDPNGHGTHVIGSIANNRRVKGNGNASMGVAPGVNLVIARALAADGGGSYASVIAAIDWIVQLRSTNTININVLNLSLYAPITAPYWDDPLGQAVMRAWQSGIVVVVAAGNEGPNAATVTVPGNVPYVITVGALKSRQFTDSGNDELASFSARGPTESAFAKPDVLVPAVRVVAPMPDDSLLAREVVAGRLREKARLDVRVGVSKKDVGYYQLSGTSMAAAEVSGVVALLLQSQPTLTNDQVKYRLKATARLAQDSTTGRAVYSIWEQGAGYLQTAAAVTGTTTEAANQNLDIATDLDTAQATHPWGETTYDAATGMFRFPELATTPAGYVEWAGATPLATVVPFWEGDPTVWTDANRVWRGANRVWRGADVTWAGDEELWAGANRVWRGALRATIASRASVDPERLDPDREYSVYVPIVIR